ncbi:MAG: ParB/RepB/Spo0J family partition protein [Ilumatobacteraceae bacterium]
MIETLSVEKIAPAKDNPRAQVGDVSELAASIIAVGILEPLIVTPDGSGGYTIVCGARRFEAAKVAGLADVPAIVRELDDAARAEIMLIENLQREDLKPTEEARAYARLLELGISQRDLGGRIGRSQSHISKRLALVELTPKAVAALDSGRITLEDAQELTKLKGMPKRIDAALAKKWNMKYAVRDELNDHHDTTLRGELVQEAKQAGLKLLSENFDFYASKKGYRALSSKGAPSHSNPLDITVAKHKKEICHAAVIVAASYNNSKPSLVRICSDPGRHSKKGDSALKAAVGGRAKPVDKEAQKRCDEAKEKREASNRRKLVIDKILGKSDFHTSNLIDHILSQTIGSANSAPSKIACELLGIEAVKPHRHSPLDYRGALLKHADKSARNALQAGLALALGWGEESTGSWSVGRTGRVHLKFLAKHGLELSDKERKSLEETDDDDD